jgi:hypothetical protein
MNLNLRAVLSAGLALALAVIATVSHGATIPVSGTWVVTNGDDTISAATANTNSPQLQPGGTPTSVSGNTVQSGFPTVTLANVGDYVEALGAVDLTRESATQLTNPNRLNTQIRIGFFNDPLPPSPTESAADSGYIAEYATGSPAANLRELNGTAANVFSGGANTSIIGSAGADPEGDSFSGTPVAANFVFRLTRIAGNQVELSGRFFGTTLDDPLDNNYLQVFPVTADTPNAAFNFSLNRIGVLIGGNTDAVAAGLRNVRIRSNLIVPEPASWLLGMVALMGGVFARRRQG